MKIISLIIFSSCSLLAQALLLEENFEYELGDLTGSVNWTASPTTGTSEIQVVDGNLSYSAYSSSDVGRMIFLDAPGGSTNRRGAKRSFTLTSSGTIYISFLIFATSTAEMNTNDTDGDYFFNTSNSTGGSLKNIINVKQGSSGDKYNIGYRKTTSQTPTWYGTELSVSTTYLIVVSYTFQTGSDDIKLWINPSLDGSEPAADIEISDGVDYSDINYVQFRQNAKSGDFYIDGIRVSDSWSQAPLPVELIDFNAAVIDNSIRLSWATATETNNYGFEVERTADRLNEGLHKWINIGFIPGHGTSYSPKFYEFFDYNPPIGNLKYRLKQIDLDGSYKYYNTFAEVTFGITDIKEEQFPGGFTLYQNYPNPFNPKTTIKFSIKRQLKEWNNTSLKIYNALGQEISSLLNKQLQAGEYEIEFDANELPSGMYYYTLKSGEYTHTRKLLLIK